MNNLQLALQLLLVGMVTVFFILFLVVTIGNIIIQFINKFLPEASTKKAVAPVTQNSVDEKKMAAIVSAVQIITKGKGKVVNVEKIS